MGLMINSDTNRLENELGLGDISQALFFPKFFEVETVNKCNAKCVMCTINDWGKRNSYLMSDVVWKKYVDEIRDYVKWVDRVNLSRDGEPLLDSKLEDKIQDLKKINIQLVTLATNASLLNRERIVSILDSGLDDIMFSIDGFTKETYEKIRRGLNYEEVRDNCINFIKIRDNGSYQTTIRIRMVLQNENEHELNSWMEFWKPMLSGSDRVYAKPIHSWGNQLKGYGEIADRIMKREKKDYSSLPCVSPWSTMIVKVNGDIPLCPVDFKCQWMMGNITTKSIKQIWNSDEFNIVRDKLISGKRNEIALCKECWLWDRDTIVEE